MRVGLVGSLDFGSGSGARTRATRLYSLLSDHHDVTFFNVNTVNTSPIPEGIEGYNLAVRPNWLPLTGRELFAGSRVPFVAADHDIDMVWAYNSYQHTPVVGYATARYLNVPLVVGVNDHRRGDGIKGYLLNRLARRHVLDSADVVVYESETLERDLTRLGVSPRRSAVVPTGIDTDPYCRPDVPLADAPTVFYVGRDTDIDLLLDAAALVHEEIPTVSVRLAGVSADAYPEYADREYVEFLGYVSQSQLYDELARAHVATVPYREAETAGRPVKILEYMAAETCIVATDLPFNTQMITDDDNGVVVEPTPSAFAEGLSSVLNDETKRQRLAQQASRDVDNYSLETMQERLLDVIETVNVSTSGD